MSEATFHKVGRTLKSFGNEGQLRIQIFDDYGEHLRAENFLHIEIDGLLVPFQIQSLKNHHKPLVNFMM